MNYREHNKKTDFMATASDLTAKQMSKRSLLKKTGLAGIGISAFIGNAAFAQNATENSTQTKHLLALMKKGDDAFNVRDFEAMNAVHHPDMIAHITGNPQPIYGRVAHAAAMKQFFATFPDVHVENNPYPVQFGKGEWITVVSRTSGTFSGKMLTPDGKTVAATGKSFNLDFGQTVKWKEDQIIEISAFWDSHLQAHQLGLA
jgi:ketosteroid isomerase-like protein